MKSWSYSQRNAVFVVGAIASLISTAPAGAFQLTPMSATLKASGSGTSQTFEVENKSDKPIPIEVSIAKRAQDIEGADILDASPSAEEKFIVYPPQFILDPKSVRSIKLTWAGGPLVDSE